MKYTVIGIILTFCLEENKVCYLDLLLFHRKQCQFSCLSSNVKELLYMTVPITAVTISSTPEEENPVKVIKGSSKLFTCRTNAGRPAARIQWYLSNENITNSATNQNNECVTDCSDAKMISSSQLTYIGNTDDSGEIIYCTAVNIEGYRVWSMNKTIDVLYLDVIDMLCDIDTDISLTQLCANISNDQFLGDDDENNSLSQIAAQAEKEFFKTEDTLDINFDVPLPDLDNISYGDFHIDAKADLNSFVNAEVSTDD
ncbi:Hypothetical predicted protein [Mytilus galloprovincialis]|uniref:Ig-like domain-containing protein n=1 Tax=Mytilus galloprovincialis TaxID=29158 RepID=A0A8B6EGX6_MYTGA|nr:Hypothetical predicted protein [Mytilus galloprovincialis]